MPGSPTAGDAFLRVEAGPEMREPAPVRRRALPLWAVRLVFAGMVVTALGASATSRGISVALVGGMLLVGLLVRMTRRSA